ncbi:MAG: ABC transporter substrate-binding protein [Opitutaceae bacterium]|nr:ABC transporter substrate-binding protein [Opitutaceae bacterium]
MPRLASALLFLFVALTATTGCGRSERTQPPIGTVAAPRKVVLQTDWFPQAEHGGFYQALARGFYAEAGLEVVIWAGGPGSGIKLKVARGDADFGLQRSDDLILAAARGMPLIAVGASMQHDPMALMVHAGSPVKEFRDLDGRAVIGNVGMAWFPFLEKKHGITIARRQNTYGLGEFLAKTDTIQQCVVTNEPFFARRHGREVRTLPFADSGYDCQHTIFTRRELTRTAPEMIRAFLAASIRGWRDYLEGDPAPADALILARNAQMTPELLAFSRRELVARRIVHGDPARGDGVGLVSPARMAAVMDELLALRILDAAVPLATVVTTEFLPAATALP